MSEPIPMKEILRRLDEDREAGRASPITPDGEHYADRAYCLPSEESVARVMFERGRGIHDARTWDEANVEMREWLTGHAAAILALFAPILAEKEREIAAALFASRHEADLCQQALEDRASAEARALAAEAALAAERERCAQIAEEVCAAPPAEFAGMELEAFHRGADAMNEAISAAIRAQE